MANEINDHYLYGKLQPEITIIMFVIFVLLPEQC